MIYGYWFFFWYEYSGNKTREGRLEVLHLFFYFLFIMKLTKKQKDFFLQKHNEVKNKNKKNEDMQMNDDVFIEIIGYLITDLDKRTLVCSMQVSRSGMTRHFWFLERYNYVFNVLYNQKTSYEKVKVCGCGMDMLFHLMYSCFYMLDKLWNWKLEGCKII